MGFFKKIFGDKDEKSFTSENFTKKIKPEWKTFEELLEQNAGLSFEKQLVFQDIIHKNPWDFDMNKGAISFGEKLTFPIQIIGTLSFENNSWLWGWANDKSNIPLSLLKQSLQIRTLGEKHDTKELITPQISTSPHFEHKIGLIASGLFASKAYYCANYGTGTMVVIITGEEIPDIDKNRLEKIPTTFSQLIGFLDANHKNTLTNYLIDRDFSIHYTENTVQGLRNNHIIAGEFDSSGRLKRLKGKF